MMKIAIDYRFAHDAFDCYLYVDDGDVRRFQQPGDRKGEYVWREIRVGEMASDLIPSFTLYRSVAKELIEQLAAHGFTPRLQTLIEGKYEAQSAHLKDLQAILRKQGYMS